MSASPMAVLGAGSWGTALALVLARNGCPVRLWARESQHVDEMKAQGLNPRYLPEYPFPKTLAVYSDLHAVLADISDLLIVVPSVGFRELITRIKPSLSPHARIAWGTKGLTQEGHFLHDIISAELGDLPLAVISGPSLAKEVAAGLPTAVTVASNDTQFSKELAERLHGPNFRVYRSEGDRQDLSYMVGLELCGSVKNILAIAAGISDGLGLGSNARAALVTRGLAEMKRLVCALGGRPETLFGLAGLGDLVLTCTENQSRNHQFGLALGQGVDVRSAQRKVGQAIEGLYNTVPVYTLAKKHVVEMPIVEQVYRILHEQLDPRQAVQELLGRALKFEA